MEYIQEGEEKKVNENTIIATVCAPVKTKLQVSASGAGALNLKIPIIWQIT